ncbi:MAG TPA: hypothetical protein VMN36_13165 [Verrucomicrobiales bacterium]|nr:hypothetical protein [Verrucomicrobiales bacterium]
MLSVVSEQATPRLGRNTIFAFRVVLALFWLYDGLVARILFPDASMLEGFGGAASVMELPAGRISAMLGSAEMALAVLVALGVFHHWTCLAQVLLVVALVWLGWPAGGGWLHRVFSVLPLGACLAFLWAYGPGSYSLRPQAKPKNAWTRG